MEQLNIFNLTKDVFGLQAELKTSTPKLVTQKQQEDQIAADNENGVIKMLRAKGFIFHTDGGHGWLEVYKHEIKMLKISKEITGYSYMDGNKVYLEEDLDAGTFITAWEKFTGRQFEEGRVFTEIYRENTPIRSYKSYK